MSDKADESGCAWCHRHETDGDREAYKECKHEILVFKRFEIHCVSCKAWWELHPRANIGGHLDVEDTFRVGPHRVCSRCKVRGGARELKAVDENGTVLEHRYVSSFSWDPVGKVELVCEECLDKAAKDRAAEWERLVALPTGNGYADQIKALMKAAPFPMSRGAVKAAGDVLWWAANVGAARVDSYTPQNTVIFAAGGTSRVTFQAGRWEEWKELHEVKGNGPVSGSEQAADWTLQPEGVETFKKWADTDAPGKVMIPLAEVEAVSRALGLEGKPRWYGVDVFRYKQSEEAS